MSAFSDRLAAKGRAGATPASSSAPQPQQPRKRNPIPEPDRPVTMASIAEERRSSGPPARPGKAGRKGGEPRRKPRSTSDYNVSDDFNFAPGELEAKDARSLEPAAAPSQPDASASKPTAAWMKTTPAGPPGLAAGSADVPTVVPRQRSVVDVGRPETAEITAASRNEALSLARAILAHARTLQWRDLNGTVPPEIRLTDEQQQVLRENRGTLSSFGSAWPDSRWKRTRIFICPICGHWNTEGRRLPPATCDEHTRNCYLPSRGCPGILMEVVDAVATVHPDGAVTLVASPPAQAPMQQA